ncbi:MAG: hypothetical protein IT518_14640 [Burkholderiales bacterium]|nr:hypothetical protein [Burkholderiales bacterium]
MNELHEVFIWFWAAAVAVTLVGLGMWVYRLATHRDDAPAPAVDGDTAAGFVENVHSVLLPMPPARWRMLGIAVVTVLLTVSIFYVARQQIGVLVYKQVLITQAVLLGYLADRAAFPYSRPHAFPAELRWRYEWRRMGLICAAMLASAWGA